MKDAISPRAAPLAWLGDQAALLLPGALAALALTLPAWRYVLLHHTGSEEIYFELRDWFLYASDFPALVAIVAWLCTPFRRRIRQMPAWLVAALGALALLATASVAWAPMRSFALYQAGRLWLLFALFLVVATTPEARGPLAWGLLISGAVQAGIGLAQFLLQRTLDLRDLGEIIMRPEWPGASVVTVAGVPTLRAYGLTQHPNLLGGILMTATLLGAGLALQPSGSKTGRGRVGGLAAAVLSAMAFGGLLLSFSRAAWLGFAAGAIAAAGVLAGWVRAKTRPEWQVPKQRVAALIVLLLTVGAVFTATQWPLLRPRLGLDWEGVEVRSADERSGLEASAWTLIREHPWLGVGYGNFSIALWQRKPEALAAYPIYQPVHRVPLLALAELGVPGLAIWLTLAAGPWIAVWHGRRRWPGDVPLGLAAATIGSLGALTVVSWFDFYPWFSQQGRLLMWIMWGLLAQTLSEPQARGAGTTRWPREEMA